MFGYYNQKKPKMASPNASTSKNPNIYGFSQETSPEDTQKLQDKQVSEKVGQSKEDRKTARAEGREYAKDVLSQEYEGLDPVKRQAMQYEANKGIQRSMQQANRKLLGEQGLHGITGKSGVGYAQQRDLQRMGAEAQAGVHRDLDKLNADLALKKLAASFNIEQGEAAQSQLDKQIALDELNLAEERKRQRFFEEQANKQLSRI